MHNHLILHSVYGVRCGALCCLCHCRNGAVPTHKFIISICVFGHVHVRTFHAVAVIGLLTLLHCYVKLCARGFVLTIADCVRWVRSIAHRILCFGCYAKCPLVQNESMPSAVQCTLRHYDTEFLGSRSLVAGCCVMSCRQWDELLRPQKQVLHWFLCETKANRTLNFGGLTVRVLLSILANLLYVMLICCAIEHVMCLLIRELADVSCRGSLYSFSTVCFCSVSARHYDPWRWRNLCILLIQVYDCNDWLLHRDVTQLSGGSS